MTPADHWDLAESSPWVRRFAPLVSEGGAVLDLACGKGRHTRLFLERGHPVSAVDKDVSHFGNIPDRTGLSAIEADLEAGPWPLEGRTFAGVVVTNYLHRPLMPHLIAALEPGGILIYETFAAGNEAFGRPSNPDYLLAPGELLHVFAGLTAVAYEHGMVERPNPAVIQHICARNAPTSSLSPKPSNRTKRPPR